MRASNHTIARQAVERQFAAQPALDRAIPYYATSRRRSAPAHLLDACYGDRTARDPHLVSIVAGALSAIDVNPNDTLNRFLREDPDMKPIFEEVILSKLQPLLIAAENDLTNGAVRAEQAVNLELPQLPIRASAK